MPLAARQPEPIYKASLLINQGRAQYMSGHYDTASALYYKSLSLLEPAGSSRLLGENYNLLGRLYRKTGQYQRAYAVYNKAMKNFELINDTSGLQTIFNESGVVYEYEKKYAEAIRRYTKAYHLARQIKDSLGMSYSLNFVAGAFIAQGRFAQSVAYNLQALRIRRRLNDKAALALIHADLAYSYYSNGQSGLAALHFDSSNLLARSMKYPDLLMANVRQQATLAHEAGRDAEAFQLMNEYAGLKDSIYHEQQTTALEEMATRYETAERTQTIKAQQKEIDWHRYLLSGIALAVFLSGWALYQTWQKQKITRTLGLQQAIAAERRYAAEAILSAEDAERRRIAAELHDGVGQLISVAHMHLSQLCEPGKDMPANAYEKLSLVSRLVNEGCEQIRAVSHQMMPSPLMSNQLGLAIEQLKTHLKDIMEVHIHGTAELPDTLSNASQSSIYRIIQESLSNARRHGKATIADVHIALEENELSITIEDNGAGFDTEAAQSDGVGLKNMRSRVQFMDGDIEWSSAPGQGTVVMISIPVKQERWKAA